MRDGRCNRRCTGGAMRPRASGLHQLAVAVLVLLAGAAGAFGVAAEARPGRRVVGIDADPLQSREHILLSTLLDQAWSAGRDLDLAALIQSIQKPGLDKIGVFDLDSPEPDRFDADDQRGLEAIAQAFMEALS